MALTADKIADLRLKHLEMVQAVVTRMAGYSATLKNYCITLVTAIAGFSVTSQKPLGSLLAIITTVVFAILDAQYLRLERRFRSLYELSRKEGFEVIPSFEINISQELPVKLSSVLLSWSIGGFYVPIIGGVTAVFLITWWIYGRVF